MKYNTKSMKQPSTLQLSVTGFSSETETKNTRG